MNDEELALRIAWLYHMEGLTQAEIAGRLNITRLRVNRMLSEARESGLVTVTLNSQFTSCVALEQALRRRFGLVDAIVVPTPGDPALVQSIVGRATGLAVSRHIEARAVANIGVGWGATLYQTFQNVRPMARPDITVHALMGGLAFGSEINTFEITSGLAGRLGAGCRHLAAPIYASSPHSRDVIVEQDVFQEVLAGIAAIDLAVVGVGDVTGRSLLVRYGLPKGVTCAELVAAGAVGDLLGHYLDRDGRPIDHPINRQVIACDLDRFRDIPAITLVAGGSYKAAMLAATLKAGLATSVVTDEETARLALEMAGD